MAQKRAEIKGQDIGVYFLIDLKKSPPQSAKLDPQKFRE
jgi:hypothetical protein